MCVELEPGSLPGRVRCASFEQKKTPTVVQNTQAGGDPTRGDGRRWTAGVTARAFRPVRIGKKGMIVLQIPVAVVAALMPTLAPGDRVTLISTGEGAPGTRDKTYQVTFRQQDRLFPNGSRSIQSRFSDGWSDVATALALTAEDAIRFEGVGEGGGVPGDGSKLDLRASVVRHLPDHLLPWPRTGRVIVHPSALSSTPCLNVTTLAFQALFPDCGVEMMVDVMVEGAQDRVWPVRLLRKHWYQGTRKTSNNSGQLSAGWAALRKAFGGTLHPGTTLEMTREGDSFGGSGPRVVDMRVVDGDDDQVDG